MLRVNGKKIELKETANPHVQKVLKEIEWIEEKFNLEKRKEKKLVLVFDDKFRKFDSINKRYRTPASFAIPMTEVLHTETGEDQWTYFSNTRNHENKPTEYLPKYIDFKGSMTIDLVKQKELAFFMICVSSHCANGMNDNASTLDYHKAYKVVDNIKDANDSASKERDVAAAKSLIYSDLSDNRLKVIARAYSVPGVDEAEDVDIIKNALSKRLDAIYSSATTKDQRAVYSNFIEECNRGTEALELRSFLQEAIEVGAILFEDNQDGKAYYFCDDGNTNALGDKITSVPSGVKEEDRIEVLIEFVKQFPDTKNQISSALEKVKEELALIEEMEKEEA